MKQWQRQPSDGFCGRCDRLILAGSPALTVRHQTTKRMTKLAVVPFDVKQAAVGKDG